jgi:plastocyanin
MREGQAPRLSTERRLSVIRLGDCLPRWRYLLLAGALGAVAVVVPALASSDTGPTVEAVNEQVGGVYAEERHRWAPTAVAVMAGGAVSFQSASATVPHGVVWDSGPATPSCTGVPVDSGDVAWKGACTFAQAGVYTFHCYVHPTEMTGKVEVAAAPATTITSPATTPSTTATGPAGPPPPAAALSLLAGTPSQALMLPRRQRGASVRGSIAVSSAAAGARLEVDLLTRRAALAAAGRGARLLVGRLVRPVPGAGRLRFAVALDRRGRRALTRRGCLALVVRLVLRPPHGRALSLTRAVSEHA